MFKTAATKIAHNSTIPALGGNQDLRPLQDLITAEKAVLISLQKFSVDYSKASEALRTWGLNEGDDLGDILSASTTILNHFSSALSQYASHGHTMRDQLKAIRTREEALEDLKRRRRNVMKKADDADKKLSKMSPEHKNLAIQTETLNRLRDEIRTMDSDIMTEEAALGDFKRTATRLWMGLKFGGLAEMCEKGTIVAEFGKMIIAEISEDITQPGLPRSLYYGHSKTENYVAEAHRCINEVTLSTVPSVGPRDRRQYEQRPQEVSYQPPANEGYAMNSGQWTPTDTNKPYPPPPIRSSNDYPNQRSFSQSSDAPGSPLTATNSAFSNQASGYATSVSQQERQTVDDFGVNSRRSPPLIDNSSAFAGRFATFPVKRSQDPPSLGSRHEQDQSFSASIAAALDGTSENAGQGAYSQPAWVAANKSSPPLAGTYGQGIASSPPSQPQQAWGPRDRTYGSPGDTSPSATNSQFLSGSSPLPPPPPGAAPPDLSDPWVNANRDGSSLLQATNNTHTRNISETSGNDALLAYMTTPRSEPPSPHLPDHPVDANLSAPEYEDEQQRISRHVRFGEVHDVNQEMEVRQSLEQERKKQEIADNEKARLMPVTPEPISAPTAVDDEKPAASDNAPANEFSPASSTSSDVNKPKSHRVPPPTFKPEDYEKALDAAAAREVSRELEALNVGQIASPTTTQQSQPDVTGNKTPVNAAPQSYSNQSSDSSPLPAPSAPFAQRNVSPHPYAELNASTSPAPPYPGGYTAAQSYAQQNSNTYGSISSSPAQAYAQSYQTSTQVPEPHPSSTVPPRFQALNQEIQVPPRFQGSRAHSPGSPTASQVPPRFQTGGASQIPPTITLPEQESRFGQAKGPETPYRTPPEYPRGLSVNPSYTKSSSSLNTSSPVISPLPGSGARTISAAAFKRPRNTSVDNLGMQGDPFKKSLPSSPYPAAREQPGSVTGDRIISTSSVSINSLPPGAGPPGTATRKSILDDDEYDYISAYVNSNPNSPNKTEFEQNAQNNAGVGSGGNAGSRFGAGSRAGYDNSRFTTDLDDGSLR